MDQWRDFSPGAAAPATWPDGIERLLSTYVSANFAMTWAGGTVTVLAGSGADARTIAIRASPRWVESSVSAADPGGSAGVHDLWACCTADSFGSATGPPTHETDTTTRSFTLKITASGTPSGSGGEALYRKIGQVIWSGSVILDVIPLLFGTAPGGDAQPGDLKATARPAAPTGWLLCDGSAVSRATYVNLFNAIGVANGPGDGATTFNLPNFQGRVPVGAGTAVAPGATFKTLGASGGEETHILTAAELPSGNWPSANSSWANDTFHKDGTGSSDPYIPRVTNPSGTISNNVGGGAHNNMQPYQVVNWVIKT